MTRSGRGRKLPDVEIDVAAAAASTPEAKRTKKDGSALNPAGWFAVYYEYPDGTVEAHGPAFQLIPELFVNCRYMGDVARIVKEACGAFEHVKVLNMRFSRGGQFQLELEDFLDELSGSDRSSPVRIYCQAPAGHVPALTPSTRQPDERYCQLAPSSMNVKNVRRVQIPQRSELGPLYMCGRPVEAGGLEAPLMHPVFGSFMENLQNPSLPTRRDYAFVQEFCVKSLDFFRNDHDRQVALTCLLVSYLKRRIDPMKINKVDGYIGNWTGFPVYSIVEVENELGSTTVDKFFQGQRYYAEFCARASEDSSAIFRSCNCPVFLVEFRGVQMRVSAMAYFDRVHASMLTDLVNISWPSENLPHIFKALKMGIDSLELFYTQVQQEGTTSTRGSWLEKVAPYPIWWKPRYIFKEELLISSGQHVYLAEDSHKRMVVIKFLRRYGDKVHKAWFNAGFAPELLDVEELVGGFKMIVMEYLGPPWQMLVLLDTETKERARVTVGKAMQELHKLRVFDASNAGSVHGDVRDINIMVRSHEKGFDVRFIDFDWAGQEGVSTYPPNMNHTSITWPEGVADGEPMLQRHDIDVLNSHDMYGVVFGYDWRRDV